MNTQHADGIDLGLKLEVDFTSRSSTHRLFGNGDPMTFLSQAGLGAAELPVGPETDPEALAVTIRQLVGAGLRVSLHPYSEATDAGVDRFRTAGEGRCRAFHEWVFQVAATTARLQHLPAVVNIHPAAAPTSVDRAALRERSVSFFKWALETCRQDAPGVQLVAELQGSPLPGEAVLRVGDTYGELLEVVTRAEVGICWDFGHSLLSHRIHGTPLDPPRELLALVKHVHCHDFRELDHQPLLYGQVPWRQYLTQLFRAGFKGTVILEVPVENFLKAGGLGALTQSVDALAEALKARRR